MGIVERLNRSGADRGDAEALERALALFGRLRARGVREEDAAEEAQGALSPRRRALFRLATDLPKAARPAPEVTFADTLEAQIRAVGAGAVALPVRRTAVLQRVVGVAAVLIFVVGVLYGGSRSLPGEPLYRVKRSVEGVRIGLASGAAEANLRVELADRRLGEVDRLIARGRSAVAGFPGRPLASAGSIDDPRLAHLIERTLEDARRQMELAAPVLISSRDADGLGRLAAVARKGRTTVSEVADELPASVQPPVLATAQSLEEIEDEAVAAKAEIEAQAAEPTPGPCDPEPTATPEPSPTPTPSSSPEPTATPSASPEPTPCVSPEPTPRPTVAPTPEATPAPSGAPATAAPEPTPRPSAKASTAATPQPEPQPSRSADDCWWLASLFVLC